MLDVEVIDTPETAAVACDPLRARILASLTEPGSSTTVALALGESRQKINYHLRTLEDHGLVELVEERPRRGLTERVVVATARSYVVSPASLAAAAPDLGSIDKLSARYLIALAARMINELGSLTRGADQAGKQLPTLAIDADVRFASAADRAAFTAELTTAITALVGRYHDESTPRGRWHRLVVAAHPTPRDTPAKGTDR